MPAVLRERFWERWPLEALTAPEWEALCDGCGRCCLVKLQDAETDQVWYTRLACSLLDCDSARCTDYAARQQRVPDCVQVTPQLAGEDWLPDTCAYRRLARGQALPDWHPLLSGRAESVREARMSVAGRVRSLDGVDEEEYEDHVIQWIHA